jgi:site-specific DNA-cytosine methylase
MKKSSKSASGKQVKLEIGDLNPRQLHEIWILLKGHDPKTKLVDFSNSIYCKKVIDSTILLNFSALLGLTTAEGGSHKLTTSGRNFVSQKSWRLWKPSKKIRKDLKEQNKLHWFIDQKLFDQRPKILDLFSGVGGLGLGFEMAGFELVAAVDDDQQACEAHKLNFPECKMLQEDISEISKNPIKRLCDRIALNRSEISGIIGGPPCQGFSYIGERSDLDERNLLTTHFIDIVVGIEPDFFVLENVPGLLNSGSKPKPEKFIQQLSKPIGVYASKIVDSLPSIPKTVGKRDRQFRKRMISDSIKAVQANILDLTSNVQDVSCAYTCFEKTSTQLNTRIREVCQDTYEENRHKDISKIIKENNGNIALITLSLIIFAIYKKEAFKSFEILDILKLVLKKVKKTLRKYIEAILKEYDTAPENTFFKDVEIGPVLQHIIDKAEKKYNVAAPVVLDSSHFGVPQARKRAFLVGIHKRKKTNFHFPNETHFVKEKSQDKKSSNKIHKQLDLEILLQDAKTKSQNTPTCEDSLKDLPDIDKFMHLKDGHELNIELLSPPLNDFAKAMRYEIILEDDFSVCRNDWNPLVLDCCRRTLHAPHALKRIIELPEGGFDKGSHRKRLFRNGLSHTIRAGTKGPKGSHTAVRPVHYEHDRVISVREGARLMSYPDWMFFHETKWHGFRMVGNGVPAYLAKAIAKKIKECNIR